MYEKTIAGLRKIVHDCKGSLTPYMRLTIGEAAVAIEELRKKVDEWQEDACMWNNEYYHLLDNTARWIPVTEALPESVDDDVLVTDGEGYAVGYWRPDAQAWDSTDFGWLENRSEPPCGIHTVTHWMPLPPLPEPQKEETR